MRRGRVLDKGILKYSVGKSLGNLLTGRERDT